ncbi:TPA: hypothetical protein DEO28_00590 [Candidatus Dependentiae bacterium]|nr:MAG: Magnesium/cobalt efflux protein [candidate division TM6 bacterium GW2011_GWE2_31_21]KKP54089.1 MAG: Magnesium/cobalt efflux protein [candidate division TM6 bacterium GW2011_GWF2_33_332]HBS48329.1 hypothetical protein [Candidatus Dependentiae bacterium]HBZ72997.1 hypothetical protein [Candidatus Dependentiae bacterium]
MSLFYVKINLFFGSLILAAVFAFLETAFTSLRLFKLKELAERKKSFAAFFEVWENSPRKILIAILIANNLAHVLCSVLITDIMQVFLGDTGFALTIGVLLATTIILIMGEILPKSYAKERCDKLLSASIWLIFILYKLLSPIVCVLTKLSDFVLKRLGGVSLENKQNNVTEKEIEFLIDYSDKEKIMEAQKTEMLQNIFSLGQTMAKDIMIPKTDMIAINANLSLVESMDVFSKYRFTRLPVYKDAEDNIIGLIHQKDIFELLYNKQSKRVDEIVMPILFIPETKKVNFLLTEFLKKRVHMAILVDEYGVVTGLITLEDIIEEIVGEISDEHEVVHQDIVNLPEGGWMVDGRVDLERVEELLNIKFDVEESVTVGGFIAEKLQRLPKKGDQVFYQGYCFQVHHATSKRVHNILIFAESQS